MPFNIRFLILVTTVIIAGCSAGASISGNQNIRPSEQTNEVARANLDLGIAYMREGEYEKALVKLERAREADPGYPPTYNMLGLLNQQLGDNNDAEVNFKKALSINKNDSETLNNYGRFLCQTDRPQEAEETFLKAVNNPLYDSPETALTNAGVCVYNNGDKEKGETYLRRALQMNSRVPLALLLMSEISYNRDDSLSARGYMQRYQAVARHTPRSLWLGIQIEQELGNADAVSSYALLLRNQFPDSPEAEQLRQARIK